MKDKNFARVRRARQTRLKIRELGAVRLTVHRTNMHIYAQVIGDGSRVLASASTAEPEMRKSVAYGGNIKAAQAIGKRIAEKAKQAGIERVAFDRAGYQFHGRIKALAEAAREGGLQF